MQKHGKNYGFHYSNFYTLLSRWEGKRFWTEWQQALPEFSLHLNFPCLKFGLVAVVPEFFNCSAFSKDLFPVFMS
jgi:hypothetical protein